MAVAAPAALALTGVSAGMQYVGNKKQQAAADTSAYFAPLIADVNAKRLETKANWIEFSAEVDKRTTDYKLESMRRLGDLEQQGYRTQAVLTRQTANRDARQLDQYAAALDKSGQEERVRMEKSSHAMVNSIRRRYSKGGVVSDSGSAALVTAEAAERAELAEQDHLRQVSEKTKQIRYQADVRRWEGNVNASLINYQGQRSQYALESALYTEELSSDIRQLEYLTSAHNARTDALLTRSSGALQQYGYQQSASAYGTTAVGSLVSGGVNIYNQGNKMGYWGNQPIS
jgi:hypothetical protein